MRFLKLALAGVCALGLAGTANSAEPVKIRMSWVAPVSNWASIVLEKKAMDVRSIGLRGEASSCRGIRQAML